MWPASYSSAEGLLTSIVLVPSESVAGGAEGELVVVGALPKDISASTLRPFFDESFRSLVPPSSAAGGGGNADGEEAAADSDLSSQWASLVLTDGAGSPFFVTAVRVGPQPGGATLAVCSAFPALSVARHVLGILRQAATATAASAGSDPGGGGGGAAASRARLSALLHAAVYALPPPVPGLKLAVGLAAGLAAPGFAALAPDGPRDTAAAARAPAAPASAASGQAPCREFGSFAWNLGDLAPLDPLVCDDVSLGAAPAAALVGAWEALLFERPVRAAAVRACFTNRAGCPLTPSD